MSVVACPKILDLPDKLLPMIGPEFNLNRYFLLEGGRGGGKSQAIARFLAYLGDKYSLRIVCGREVQNSINESVYSLFVDIITFNKLDYEIFSTRIVHRRTGTTINFRGFREQGKFNIQGMEGVDIVWIDEAQAIHKETLDILIPTIRKDNAKIFFSMNRHIHKDPVYVFCDGRSDCLHIHINYWENKHCTLALKNEAKECQKRSQDDYNHIWLGIPLAMSEDAVFGHDELQSTTKIQNQIHEGYGMTLGGFDVARYGDDKCSVVGIRQLGALHWEVYHVDVWDHRDLSYTTGRILQESQEQGFERSIIDEDGLGAGPLDMLNKGRQMPEFVGFRNLPVGFRDDQHYANPRTAAVYKLKEMIAKGHIRIKHPKLLKELEEAFRYTFDNYQRKILISKEVMKTKHGVKSPNIADALIMAVTLIGTVDYKQASYLNRRPQYSTEDNILAGIR